MLSDELKRAKLCVIARHCLRNHVPVEDMKKEANVETTKEDLKGTSSPLARTSQSDYGIRFNKFASQSWVTGRFKEASLGKMLYDVGVCVDPADIPIIFYHFDVSMDNYISRDEFTEVKFCRRPAYETLWSFVSLISNTPPAILT